MIDIDRAKDVFDRYTKDYDSSIGRIRLKIIHTYRVAENARIIAKSIGLDDDNVRLAWLIGLLHDIGRFDQIKLYNTFRDCDSVNHAMLGSKILFEDGMIRKFVNDSKYDNIIKLAIENHNKIKIDDGILGLELIHCKIIRDADKIDIFRVVTTEKLEDALPLKNRVISEEILSEEIYNEFFKEKTIDYNIVKSNADYLLVWMGFIFDINFKKSFEMIKENNYISKIVNRVNFKDELTKKRMKEIEGHAKLYIEEKIKKDD